MFRRGKWAGLLAIALVFVFTSQAYAYLDPGTGSMILQGLIAAFTAVIAFFGLFWGRLKGFFGRFKKQQSEDGKPGIRDS